MTAPLSRPTRPAGQAEANPFAGVSILSVRVRALLAPQLRGHIDPRLFPSLRARGWHVHRIGQAAYVHGDGHHLILGAWGRHDPAPAWADRLGQASAGYWRRWDRADRRQTGRLMLRDARGRFRVRLPWWRQPGPRPYSWELPAPSFYEQEQVAAAANRARALRRGWVS